MSKPSNIEQWAWDKAVAYVQNMVLEFPGIIFPNGQESVVRVIARAFVEAIHKGGE